MLEDNRLQKAMQELQEETEKALQFFIDTDLSLYGEIKAGTLEAIAVQGYEYNDGKLVQAAESEPITPPPDEPINSNTVAEKLYSRGKKDYYLFHDLNNSTPAWLSIETLRLIEEKAEKYVIIADALALSESDLKQYNIEFLKFPRDWEMIPETVRERINEVRPDYKQKWLESTQFERDYQRNFEEWKKTQPEERKENLMEETKKKLTFIDVDDWSRPVYQDESGKLWKDLNFGKGDPDLYSSSSNAFDGEPDMPIKGEFEIIKTEEPKSIYYPINEEQARLAKNANSFFDYEQGSTTAGYKQMVDEAVKIAERQKSIVEPMYHEKIDNLLDRYARKLAENINNRNAIEARVPSIMISGGSNFPVHKKHKQNEARGKNWEEWGQIKGLLEKIQGVGTGGISADDPNALKRLQEKLDSMKESHETMKAANAYFRKHKTLDGCPNLSEKTIKSVYETMERCPWVKSPFSLTNSNAEIKRLEGRIEEITSKNEFNFTNWEFNGGNVEINKEDNRLQVFFDSKPDEETRKELKGNGFKWSPKVGAWQRQLTLNAFHSADRMECIKPLTGEKPTQLQKKARAETTQAVHQTEQQPPEYTQGGNFFIYQLKDEPETKGLLFESFDRVMSQGITPNISNYIERYSGEISTEDLQNPQLLEKIFERFNIDRPADFKGHSLSVSDVIVINDGGENAKVHYCDRSGFKEIPDFYVEKAVEQEIPAAHQQEQPETEITPVYLHTLTHAVDNGERALFIKSKVLNDECATDLGNAIATHCEYTGNGGGYYDFPTALKEVTEKYGTERVNAVVAHVVNNHSWDGRLSEVNKDWAKGIETPKVDYITLKTHLSVLDGFVSHLRKAEQEIKQEQPPAHQTEQPAAPTLAELDKAVKDGETISITDLFNAVKKEGLPDKKPKRSITKRIKDDKAAEKTAQEKTEPSKSKSKKKDEQDL